MTHPRSPIPTTILLQATHMDKADEITRLRAEYVTAAKRVIDAIKQCGTNSEIFFRASADFNALIQRIKNCDGGKTS